ncbi:MAG: hypothetical protein ABFD21_01750 [Anaerolineaceae bacterium]
MNAMDIVLGIIGIALSVMIFSYLLGDNFFFRVALYILVGVSSGYAAAVLLTKVILPRLIEPLKQSGTDAFWLALVPLVLCLLLSLMLIPRLVKAGTLPLAFLAGAGAAVAIAGIPRGTLAPQLLSVVNRFSPELLRENAGADWGGILEALFILLGVVSVLFYFHHRLSRKSAGAQRPPLVEGISSVGQLFLGITLGMLFVGFYSAALTALIARMVWLKEFILALLTE